MRPSSSTSEAAGPLGGGLLAPLFTAGAVGAATSDAALLQAMLDVERELAAAQAGLGLVPAGAAAAIGAACRADGYDPDALGRAALSAGNPVPALVRALTDAVPPEARPYVHLGSTSQDVLDTALALVAKRAGEPLLADLTAAADACADLARAHRGTLMSARTLGQQALPTTFGLKAAGWLVALDDAASRLRRVLDERLAVQLGGAVGTLAGLGEAGVPLVAAVAGRLGLAEPVLAWHTDRQRVLDLGAALAAVLAVGGKIGLDLELLAATEVAEVLPGTGGGSSAMPHKRNPVGAILLRSAAIRAPGLLATLHAAAAQEHERAAGGWHAEWDVLRELLWLAGGAAARLAGELPHVIVDSGRMRATFDATDGLPLSESVAARLAPALGRTRAHEVVGAAARRSVESGTSFHDVLAADPDVAGVLSGEDLAAALDPAGWLGSAELLIDRALTAHAEGER